VDRVGARRPWLGERDAAAPARSGRQSIWVAAATVLLALLAPAAAVAAPLPGTPLTVAPGVPGHGRAWELVSPPDFFSASLLGVNAVAPTGDRLVYRSAGPLPGASSPRPLVAANLAVRGGDGWTTTPQSAPFPDAQIAFSETRPATGPLAFAPDLTGTIWRAELPLEAGQAEAEIGLFRQSPDGQFALLAEIGLEGGFVGASEDLGRVFFTSENHLLAADAGRTAGASLYEVAGSALRLVDADAGGSPLSDCGAVASGPGAVSRDGRRAFFATSPCAGALAGVYLGEAGSTPKRISASQCTLPGCGPPASAEFVGATPSGASAFLVSAEKLTDADADADAAPDLYRYDAADERLTLLSAAAGLDVEPTPGEAVAASPDGASVFFCGGVLNNLFLADRGALTAIPSRCPGAIRWSADSRFAVFATKAALVADDADTSTDVYRYDRESGQLTELSASEGTAGNGAFDTEFVPVEAAGELPGGAAVPMSEDGGEVFFSSAERLVLQDRNDVRDVYEWADGRLDLVSAGAGGAPATLLGLDRGGDTVLFRTAATLLPRDRDGGDPDVYAARVGGGFPEPALPTGCTSGCGAAAGARLALSTPPSARALGGGILLRPLGPAALRQVVASGRLTLLAEVPHGGRLEARASARIGGRSRTVAAASAEVRQRGPVRLSLPLAAVARKRLAAGQDLRVGLVLRLSAPAARRHSSFELRGAP